MAVTHFWFVGFAVLCSFSMGQTTSTNVTLTCPSDWMDGKTEILTCRIRMASFSESACSKGFDGVVLFRFQHASDSTPGNVCTSNCGDMDFKAEGCRCKGIQNEHYVLEYFVTANETTHEGGTWMCVPVCYDTSGKNVFLDSTQKKALSCGPVKFGEPPEPTTPSCEASTTRDVSGTTICSTSSAVVHAMPVTRAFLVIVVTMLLFSPD